MKITIPIELDLGPLFKPAKPQPRLRLDGTYHFTDAVGRFLFDKVRYRTDDGKTFRYRWRLHHSAPWVYEKPTLAKGAPFDADDYLWRLRHVRQAVRDRAEVWWTEGEKDAMAVCQAGRCATSHHGAAGKVSLAQAQWLSGARRVVLCIDNDPSGAMDGALRWRRLVEQVGIRRGRVQVVRAVQGKDVADHLAAGLGLADMQRVDVGWLLEEGDKWTAEQGARDGYTVGFTAIVNGVRYEL